METLFCITHFEWDVFFSELLAEYCGSIDMVMGGEFFADFLFKGLIVSGYGNKL